MGRSRNPFSYPDSFFMVAKEVSVSGKEVVIKVDTPGQAHSLCTTLYAWRKAVETYEGSRLAEVIPMRAVTQVISFAKDPEKKEVYVRRGSTGRNYSAMIMRALGRKTAEEEAEESLERMKKMMEGQEGGGKGDAGLEEKRDVGLSMFLNQTTGVKGNE